MLLDVLVTIVLWVSSTDALDAVNPKMSVQMTPSDAIYIGERTTVRTELHFPEPVYRNISLTLYPSLDGPDFVITKIKSVTLGKSLRLTGSLKPILDFNPYHAVENALSCQFELGSVKHVQPANGLKDVSFVVEYEGRVPEVRDESVGAGHRHDLGASLVVAGNKRALVEVVSTTYKIRSLPLLFKSMEQKQGRNELVREMEAQRMRERKIVSVQ